MVGGDKDKSSRRTVSANGRRALARKLSHQWQSCSTSATYPPHGGTPAVGFELSSCTVVARRTICGTKLVDHLHTWRWKSGSLRGLLVSVRHVLTYGRYTSKQSSPAPHVRELMALATADVGT